jgi:predicted P-loop ATPase
VTTEEFLEQWQAEADTSKRNASLRDFLLTLKDTPAIERAEVLAQVAAGCRIKISVIKAQLRELLKPPKRDAPTFEWASQLMRRETTNGVEILAHVENLRVILAKHPTLENVITYNEFTNQIDIRRPVRLHDGLAIGAKRTQWCTTDTTNLRSWINRTIDIDPKLADIEAAIKAEAERRAYHPVRDYLLGLPPWDGTARLPSVFEDYFGTTKGGDSATDERRHHNELAAFYWFQSLVARVMPGHIPTRFRRPDATRDSACGPGCFVKYSLVLEGPTSILKSQALRAFLPVMAWYTEADLDLGKEKQMGEILAGKWICELQEFDKLQKFHSGDLKSALSRRTDRYRAAYAHGSAVDNPRHCVFVGTTNEYEYHRDYAGNVRFWSIQCGTAQGLSRHFQINIAGLERAAPQLLAEALHYYGHGWQDTNANDDCPFYSRKAHQAGAETHLCFRWWPTPREEAGIFKGEQTARLIELPNERVIADWLREPIFDSSTSAWSDLSVIPTDIVTRCALRTNDPMQLTQLKAQVEDCLKRAGWIKDSFWSPTAKRTVRGWRNPAKEVEQIKPGSTDVVHGCLADWA